MNNSSPMDNALKKLMDGNRRYVASRLLHPNQTPERRIEVKDVQKPIAVVLTCSDSRVPPELLFDQGIGDLFVIRVAGPVVNNAVLGSIEYASLHLNVPLILVMGHSKCGAVQAAMTGSDHEGHISEITDAIYPALDKSKGLPGDKGDNASKSNVMIITDQLRNTGAHLSGLEIKKKLAIVPVFYDLETGTVEILSGRHWQ